MCNTTQFTKSTAAFFLVSFAWHPKSIAEDVLLALGYTSNNVPSYAFPSGAPAGELILGAAGGLSFPHAMIEDDGKLLVASWGNNAIFEFDGTTGAFIRILTVAQPGGFNLPSGMSIGPDGALYVSSLLTDAVLRFNRESGELLGVFADSTDGLDEPDAMIWQSDRLLICSRANNRVVSLNAGGVPTPFIWNDPGTPQDETGGLLSPRGLTVATGGRLIVSSGTSHRVIAYQLDTGALVGAVVGPGGGGLNDPRGIIECENGDLLIASFGTSSVKRYTSAGASLGDFVPSFAGNLVHPTQLLLRTSGPAALPGDMNCDGALSVGDISGFVLALTNPAGYAAAFPNCDALLADVSQDGTVSVGDIGPFVVALTR